MTENERVRMIRQDVGHTMREFGAVLGVGSSTISDIENGRRNLTTPMSRLICEKYHICEEWLRTGKGPMKDPEPSGDDLDACLDKWGLPREFRGLFLRYAKLSPSAQKEVVEQVRAWAVELAAEIASEERSASGPTEKESGQKPWNEMTKEEKLAEFARQLDEEEETHGDEPKSGGLVAG